MASNTKRCRRWRHANAQCTQCKTLLQTRRLAGASAGAAAFEAEARRRALIDVPWRVTSKPGVDGGKLYHLEAGMLWR
jgi:hypothetical protein